MHFVAILKFSNSILLLIVYFIYLFTLGYEKKFNPEYLQKIWVLLPKYVHIKRQTFRVLFLQCLLLYRMKKCVSVIEVSPKSY